jgi:acyl-CoA thioesterase I
VKLAAVVGVVLCIGANVLVTALRSRTYPSYWLDRMNELAPPDAVQLVAFGDSSVQAIGAERPTDGYVGRIADYIQARTHRPVHISNVSDGGTTRDIIDRQLPKVDVRSAHLVVIGSANDMEQRAPLAQYRADLAALLDALPADRTIISDLPLFPGRDPYQAVLADEADARGIRRADFGAILGSSGRRLDIFSWLPPHMNSRGYGYWFQAFRPAVEEVIEHW